MSDELEIRPYQEADEKAVAALWREIFVDESAYNVPEKDIWRKLEVQRELFLVAEDEGSVVGTTMAGFDGHRAWVHLVVVSPRARRRGIGTVLMREAETAAGRNLWLIAAFNMAAGYASSLALGYFVLRGRKVKQLIPQLVFIPVYWLLISAAAYRAVWQFIWAPQRWEKTEHGLTKHRRYQSWLPYS